MVVPSQQGVPWREVLPLLGFGMQAAATIIALFYGWSWIRSRRAAKEGVPGPAFVPPVIGESLSLIKSPAKYMWNKWIQFGGIFRTNLLGYNVYVVGSPAIVRSVWSDDEAFDFFVPGKTFTMLLTDIRHMRDPEQHAVFRRKLGQALNPTSLATHLLPPMEALMTRHLDRWAQQGRIPLAEACAELSLDVALDVVTGLPLPPEGSSDRALVRRLFRTTLDGLYGLPVVLPGTAIHSALRARRRLMEILCPLVEAEVAGLEAQSDRGPRTTTTTPAAPATADGAPDANEGAAQPAAGPSAAGQDTAGDAAAPPMRMLEAQIASAAPFRKTSLPLSPEQLFERALGNVIAVDETSRHLFFAAVTAVALAGDVKKSLEEEQREVLRKHGEDLSYSVLNGLPYLDAVIKETLRLFPPSIGGFRVAKKDVRLDAIPGSNPAAVITAGSVVFWSTHLLHCSDPALLPRTPAPERPSSGPLASAINGGLKALNGTASETSTSTSATAAGPPGDADRKPGVNAGFDTVAARRALARSWAGPTGLPTHLDFQVRFEEAFRPERWLSEETRPRQFATFGGGGYLCLGQHVAMAEAKLLVALLLRRFDLRLQTPGLLSTCSAFPGLKPRKGTDGLVLVARQLLLE